MLRSSTLPHPRLRSESLGTARDLARRVAIFAGGSSGAALWGVRQLVARLDRPARIATLFPDSGNRYLSTIYDDGWLAAQGLAEPAG